MSRLVIALLLLVPITAHAQNCSVRSLQTELAKRSERDQLARAPLLKNPRDKAASNNAVKVDADNTAWMRKMITKCGWPKASKIGKTSAKQAWLLTQHADMAPDYQVYAAEKLKAAVLENEAEPWDLAVLVDRNRRLQKKPQVYGMQFKEEPAGVVRFFDIEQPELLDERQKEIGIEPFYCWALKISGKGNTPLSWPSGVLFKPETCAAAP